MKRITLLIVFIILVPVLLSSQNFEEVPKDTELQKVKDALVISVIHCQDLEKQNEYLNSVIKKVAEDLKLIKTIQQLDSLKIVYGINKKK
jgi:hypothetical protein